MALLEFEPSRFPGIFIEQGNGGFYGPAAKVLHTLGRMKIGYDILDIISKRTRGIGIGGATPTPGHMKCIVRRGPGSLSSERAMNTFASRLMNANFVVTDDTVDDFGGEYGVHHTQRQQVTGPGGHKFTVARAGTSAVATFEPSFDYPTMVPESPHFVVLGHELIHCMHFLSGDTSSYRAGDPWGAGDSYMKHEEARTVGLGIYTHTRISENAIRKEAKLKIRTFYSSPGDCDGLTSASKP
ncbi:MAG: hypothetical protein EXR07_11675 [Acetobacteraceae bacterium]|nr:hypothetical protein [Acetobacteraceae bacterium]